jgi:peptide/nickel transport system substrate-binding protein
MIRQGHGIVKRAYQSTKGLFLLCFFISTALLLTPAFSSGTKYGGEMVLAVTSDPRSFNPVLAKETSTTQVLSPLFEGLTRTDPFDLRVRPNLAERWESDPQGLVWTFFLRKGLFWSDGRPLTADDVVFTFNSLIFNEAIPSSSRDIFTVAGRRFRVEKAGDLAVRFTLPARFAPFLRSLSVEILPRHVLEGALQQGKFNFTWGVDAPVKQIVGSGPYRLREYRPGQRLVYEPNPYYWKRSPEGGRLPYIQKLIYIIVPGLDVELLKFLEGSIDAYGMRGLDYPLLKPLEKKKGFDIFDLGPDMGASFIAFNQNPGINPATRKPFVPPYKLAWFRDVRFRRAVAHAVDKKRIIEIVKNGLGYAQDSPESPSSGFFHCPDVRRYDYDLDRARELLKEAGFSDRDHNGVLEDPAGHPLEFTLYTNADNTERADIASIIRNDLESLGMKVNLQLVEFNTLVSKLTSTFDWDLIVLGLTGTIDPHFGQNVWLSSGQLHLWNPMQRTPATAWEKRIDEIFTLAVSEMDEARRKVYYDEYQKIIAEEVPLVYTALGARLTAVRRKFGNLKPAVYGGVFHNLEEIYIKGGDGL